jgi:hypothetical protein
MKTNGIEDPDINPHNYSHLIFDKGALNMSWRKHPLQKLVLGKVDLHLQKTETRS